MRAVVHYLYRQVIRCLIRFLKFIKTVSMTCSKSKMFGWSIAKSKRRQFKKRTHTILFCAYASKYSHLEAHIYLVRFTVFLHFFFLKYINVDNRPFEVRLEAKSSTSSRWGMSLCCNAPQEQKYIARSR